MSLRFLAVFVLVLAGCNRAAPDPLERATRGIQARHIERHGAYLASDAMSGRHYASSQGDSAVAYLQRTLAAADIRPVQLADDLLGNAPRSFVHTFSVNLHRLGRENKLDRLSDARLQEAVLGRDYLPLLFSRNARLSGRATRVKDLDVLPELRDRVAVVWESALQPQAGEAWDSALFRASRRLEAAGAEAAVFAGLDDWFRLASATYPSQLPPELLERTRSPRGLRENLSPDRISMVAQAAAWRQAPERTIPALVARPGWEAGLEEGEEIGIVVDLATEVSLGQNLLVGFGAAVPSRDLIVLAANYDHAGVNAAGEILNAADDNASGVAALLEIAVALGRVRGSLGKHVLVAFVSAEVHGAVGSEMVLRDLPLLLGNVQPRALLYLDAVGRNGTQPLQIATTSVDKATLRLLETLNDRRYLDAPTLLLATGPERFVSDPPALFETTTQLFARAGIPTLHWNDGLDPLLYGLPEDDWSLVDAEKVARVARLAFLTTYSLATRAPVNYPAGAP